MSKMIKVRVNLIIEVDAEAWQATYGPGPEALREDIKSYAVGCVQQSAGMDECYGTVWRTN